MSEVAFQQASRVFGGDRTVRAVDRLDLEIADGEFLVLVGPSGSGKSTALRMLAGLDPTDEGSIFIGGRDVTGVEPKDRDIAMVFQSYALYPHMTVAQNMEFALRLQKLPAAERRSRVEDAAKLLDLTEYLDRKPKALSGGQRQRVAMGRAIVREPSVFLMDEPLSNLDAKLRVQTRANIVALQRRLATTTVYVTHDQTEAMTMGDRVAVLRDGVLQQCAPPKELYARPRNTFVAGFIGSPAMNFLPAKVTADGVLPVGYEGTALSVTGAAAAQGEVTIGFRPEGVTLSTEGLPARVELVEELGATAFVHATVDVAGEEHRLTVQTDGASSPSIGENVRLQLDGSRAHLFDAGGDRLE
ncbi:ABC transporter ATP-binding protein [Pseudonocardia sp. HH130630-07]|uniref:ABC transporter ATP-binding protein n=1 Tax=Pseudonocardia sp. HH130630-07 TaxID=1690815 RepID=UPI0008150B78|nr:ABC transporter ATP-binding protein [Pseudonocardia sp. HH130630-07]ANY07859.1 sugar ABC transporter ATP-binding protein [Pseudonocardia sp. HH130630-07]